MNLFIYALLIAGTLFGSILLSIYFPLMQAFWNRWFEKNKTITPLMLQDLSKVQPIAIRVSGNTPNTPFGKKIN